jgi:spermidine dehydrogenase
VKAIYPDAIQGSREFQAIASGPVNLAALDRVDARHRMRLKSTAVRIWHEGNPGTANRVNVVYEKGGELYRVQARAAVVNIGSWVARNIVSDLPDEYRMAFGRFFYVPILMVSVALRNWRFLDKLGFGTARWFDGFGFFGTIRRPMVIGSNPAPFHPDKPIVMTFYVPIQSPDLPLEAEGPAGRAQLYGTSYADYERKVVRQMQRMFSAGGFDARRDIAGIVLNRWGHAMPTPPPGFYFGTDGSPPPRDILRKRFGRIAFGHSEMGRGDWVGAADEGKRAMIQVLS